VERRVEALDGEQRVARHRRQRVGDLVRRQGRPVLERERVALLVDARRRAGGALAAAQDEARLRQRHLGAGEVQRPEHVAVAQHVLRLQAEHHDVGPERPSVATPAQQRLVDAVRADAEVQHLGRDVALGERALERRGPGLVRADLVAEGERVAEQRDAQRPFWLDARELALGADRVDVDAERAGLAARAAPRRPAEVWVVGEERVARLQVREVVADLVERQAVGQQALRAEPDLAARVGLGREARDDLARDQRQDESSGDGERAARGASPHAARKGSLRASRR
jgi:hypothetical protein